MAPLQQRLALTHAHLHPDILAATQDASSLALAMASTKKPVTLFFLQASRCIRTAWLLEGLKIPYDLKFADRQNQKAPEDFKAASGNPLGKFPTLVDGDLVVHESGAIAEYICDKYDGAGYYISKDRPERAKTLIWVHAAEATFMLHALALIYARWGFPKEADKKILDEQQDFMSGNVQRDLDWLEDELAESKSGWLVGEHETAADVAMHFSVEFIFSRKIGTSGKTWPKTEEWLKKCESTEAFRKAKERSGYTLFPKTI